MSLNGAVEGRPLRASWNARSTNSIVGAMSRDPVWWSCRLWPGLAVKLGSSDSARLIFTTPLRVFHRSMSLTKSAGSSSRAIWSKNAVFGCRLVTTMGA